MLYNTLIVMEYNTILYGIDIFKQDLIHIQYRYLFDLNLKLKLFAFAWKYLFNIHIHTFHFALFSNAHSPNKSLNFISKFLPSAILFSEN